MIKSLLAAASYAAMLAVAKAVPRYDCIALLVFLWFIFRELDRETAKRRALGLIGVTTILYVGFLLHLWTLGYEGRNAVFGGILPWSDSHDYYSDALRLWHGLRFDEVGSKRPLYAVAMSLLLRVTNGDLRVIFLISAVVGAWATAIAALAVWKTHGWKSALVVYLALLFIERRWTGFVQTEHFGLPLGALAFALVWRAQWMIDFARAGRARKWVLAGLFALTLALVARTGSFFVLPAIGWWAAKRLAPPSRVRYLAFAGAVVLSGLAFNRAVVASCGSGVMFSDYPGIVYGMMHDEGFDYLGRAHPELGTLPVDERVPAAWDVVKTESREHPSLLVAGLARSGAGLFVSPFGMFGYVWTNPDDHVLENGPKEIGPALAKWKNELGLYSLLNAGAMGALGGVLVLASLVALFLLYVKRRHDPELSLMRWAYAGILLSAPFLPPHITSGQQTQTATMAFVAALPAVVFLGKRRDEDDEVKTNALAWTPLAVAVVLVGTIAWMRLAPALAPPCEAGKEMLQVFATDDVVVTDRRTFSPRQNALADLRASLPLLSKHNPELTSSVEPFLRPGTRYVMAYDACDGVAKAVVDERGVLPAKTGWTSIEAQPLATRLVLEAGAKPPPKVSARAESPYVVHLSWEDFAVSEIATKQKDGSFMRVALLDPSAREFVHHLRLPGETYTYRVRSSEGRDGIVTAETPKAGAPPNAEPMGPCIPPVTKPPPPSGCNPDIETIADVIASVPTAGDGCTRRLMAKVDGCTRELGAFMMQAEIVPVPGHDTEGFPLLAGIRGAGEFVGVQIAFLQYSHGRYVLVDEGLYCPENEPPSAKCQRDQRPVLP